MWHTHCSLFSLHCSNIAFFLICWVWWLFWPGSWITPVHLWSFQDGFGQPPANLVGCLFAWGQWEIPLAVGWKLGKKSGTRCIWGREEVCDFSAQWSSNLLVPWPQSINLPTNQTFLQGTLWKIYSWQPYTKISGNQTSIPGSKFSLKLVWLVRCVAREKKHF